MSPTAKKTVSAKKPAQGKSAPAKRAAAKKPAPVKRAAAQKTPLVTVLCGGCSSERAVSLVSGQKVFEALSVHFEARLKVLDEHALPEDLNPRETVVFPAFHGTWGEDGGVQTLLEARGFAYAGCGPQSSARCMDKIATKQAARAAKIPVVDELFFEAAKKPVVKDVIAALGDSLVVKPVDEGSSVGLHMVKGAAQLKKVFAQIKKGRWMVEPRIVGREFAVGVLDGEAMGIVEIIPEGGVYDYQHKYTAGSTRYEFPAKLAAPVARGMRAAAQKAFAACGCRDFSRVDFMMDGAGKFYLLEINTIPGLTATSLLPKSASCAGLDFPALAKRMVQPAIARWRKRR